MKYKNKQPYIKRMVNTQAQPVKKKKLSKNHIFVLILMIVWTIGAVLGSLSFFGTRVDNKSSMRTISAGAYNEDALVQDKFTYTPVSLSGMILSVPYTDSYGNQRYYFETFGSSITFVFDYVRETIYLQWFDGDNIQNTYEFTDINNSAYMVGFNAVVHFSVALSDVTPVSLFDRDSYPQELTVLYNGESGISFVFKMVDESGKSFLFDFQFNLIVAYDGHTNSGLDGIYSPLFGWLNPARTYTEEIKNYTYRDLMDNATDFNDGYDIGYNAGYNAGETSGYNSGYQQGKDYGYDVGYDVGFGDGVNDSNTYTFFNLITSVVDVPVNAFTSLLNFELLGVNLLDFVGGLLFIGLVSFVLKLFF